MAPRSPISATIADWLASVRAFFGYIQAPPALSDETVRRASFAYAPLAGTLIRVQARYGSLNARIRREADRVALWLLAKVDLPEGVSNLLLEGLSEAGQADHTAGKVPAFKERALHAASLAAICAQGQAIIFDDEAADDQAYEAAYCAGDPS